MRPLTVSAVIDAPRERLFDYLVDVANHAEFTDHFLKDFRLERLASRGVGASASFRVEAAAARLPLARPLFGLWGEIVITSVEPPYRIWIDGHAGRLGRVALAIEYRLVLDGDDMTKVELTFASEPAKRSDALREALGARPWLRAKLRTALRRVRSILEEGEPSAHAVRVAAG
jgi:uncharacterized protein YndB with AHSA1/START domain